MRMVQRSQHAGFAPEPGELVAGMSQARRQRLDSDIAAKDLIVRAVDFPHAARSQPGDNLIRSKLPANEGFGWGDRNLGGASDAEGCCCDGLPGVKTPVG